MRRVLTATAACAGSAMFIGCAELDVDTTWQENQTPYIQGFIDANQPLPIGTYVVSGLRVRAGKTVTSVSRMGTTLQLARSSSAPIMFIEGSDVRIHDIAFDGDKDHQPDDDHVGWQGRSNAAAIRIDSPVEPFTSLSSIHVYDCSFTRVRGSSVATKRNINGLTVDNNDFSTLEGEAVFLDVQDIQIGSRDVTITNNNVVGVDNLNGANAFLVNQVNGLTFRYNTASTFDKNMLKATNVTNGLIANNSATSNGFSPGAFAAIQLDTLCTNVQVSSNVFTNVYAGVAVNGALGTSGITISDNMIGPLIAHQDAMGVKIGDSTGGSITISNNRFTGLQSDGIRVASGANGVSITGNRIERAQTATLSGTGIKFDINDDVNLTSLSIRNNCIQGYGFTAPNRGLIFVNTDQGGGSGVSIDNNVALVDARLTGTQLSNRRTIFVGPFAEPTIEVVDGSVTNNRYRGKAPEADALNVVFSSNTPTTDTTCP